MDIIGRLKSILVYYAARFAYIPHRAGPWGIEFLTIMSFSSAFIVFGRLCGLPFLFFNFILGLKCSGIKPIVIFNSIVKYSLVLHSILAKFIFVCLVEKLSLSGKRRIGISIMIGRGNKNGVL